ncbi:hypothetical protein HZF05_20160 [Sphingomonas sp. CGMCC 1.13654]|uniref:DUF4386 family protein n=1 Tax=Sphingomonas chungangi TaxID=2683589 RepID=A0A838LAG4_9SPHN|nr:hypothetical protein [Sphingomonas chungangi]MBA2936403.1 hypothetical protein [Sphingomonas chungangi]MVW55788.1 hypothetical protein [Sphingomonas chungangi]
MTDASLRASGACLCAAAVATLALNLLVSPHLPAGSFAVIAASRVYFLRQVIASAVALALVFGLAGVRDGRLAGSGAFAAIACTSALGGQVLLFAVEYGQAFFVHDYALHAPAALDAAMGGPHGPLAIGAVLAIAVFYLGWLLLAIALLLARRIPRSITALLLFGFVATPVLNAIKALGVAGGILASLIVGAGWFLLGLRMIRTPRGEP